MDELAGVEEKLVDEEGSEDDLINEIRASPPPCKFNHDDSHEDDPQLILGNLKKFQANIRECSRFAVVSTKSSIIFLYI